MKIMHDFFRIKDLSVTIEQSRIANDMIFRNHFFIRLTKQTAKYN
jgi:hypothetical protein